MTRPQNDWYRDLIAAADEQGYQILTTSPSKVVLGRRDVEVTIESVLMSGALLRRILAPEYPMEDR